jgi:hypothetical protein
VVTDTGVMTDVGVMMDVAINGTLKGNMASECGLECGGSKMLTCRTHTNAGIEAGVRRRVRCWPHPPGIDPLDLDRVLAVLAAVVEIKLVAVVLRRQLARCPRDCLELHI